MSAPPKTQVSDIIDRRNESRRYYQTNYWDEWEMVYRAAKCRTQPIMTKDRAGNDVEDEARTNVCMPEMSLIRRRKTARLTANPPQINYTTPNGPDDPVADKLTAQAYQEYDRSGEAIEHRRVVDSGNLFGRGISKLSYDTIEVMRKVRRAITDADGKPKMDRQQLMEFQGKTQDEIDKSVAVYGSQLDDDLIKQLLLDAGKNEISGIQAVQRYQGPIVRNVFLGDFYDEPGCRTLNESGWIVENYWETDVWLQKMLRQKFIDPETGQERPVFDLKSVIELVDTPAPSIQNTNQQPFDLRTRLRTAAMGQTIPNYPTRLVPGKRFDILESHQRDEYGTMWKSWVGNEKILLGKMPYNWDLYGKYQYTEFVPMPDMLNTVGDSSPRLLRWLHLLHNATVGARKDLVGQLLRPLILQRFGEDVPDEAIQRALFKILQVKDLNSFKPFVEPGHVASAIGAANEEEAQILRMLAMAEPSLTITDSGSESNPMAGKTATTAVLAAKSADALTQSELDQLNIYLKELGEKKLWMNQQAMQGPIELASKFVSQVKGLSERYGKTTSITIDPMEIQEDIQVEPVAMSMLSVDDELRRNAAQQFYMLAASNPAVFDVQYAAEQYASTIRGIDVGRAVKQPQPPPPQPPKASIAIAAKWPELPADVQKQLIAGMGGQITPQVEADLDEQQTMQDIQHVSDAADAAANLHAPPDHTMNIMNAKINHATA